jgi:hypothetical protein
MIIFEDLEEKDHCPIEFDVVDVIFYFSQGLFQLTAVSLIWACEFPAECSLFFVNLLNWTTTMFLPMIRARSKGLTLLPTLMPPRSMFRYVFWTL